MESIGSSRVVHCLALWFTDVHSYLYWVGLQIVWPDCIYIGLLVGRRSCVVLSSNMSLSVSGVSFSACSCLQTAAGIGCYCLGNECMEHVVWCRNLWMAGQLWPLLLSTFSPVSLVAGHRHCHLTWGFTFLFSSPVILVSSPVSSLEYE